MKKEEENRKKLKEYKRNKKRIKKLKQKNSSSFVIALSVVSILGFLNIVLHSFFNFNFTNYMDTLWLLVLGIALILDSTIKELKLIKKKGLNSNYLGKITMIIIGVIAIIAGILSLPQINIQSSSFLAIKGVVGILAITLIILQTWVLNKNN
jgi:uncharacterized membrane protein HdeD (DUF308 family)